MKTNQESKNEEIRPLLDDPDVKLESIHYQKLFDLEQMIDLPSKLIALGLPPDLINFHGITPVPELQITATFRIRSDTAIGKAIESRNE